MSEKHVKDFIPETEEADKQVERTGFGSKKTCGGLEGDVEQTGPAHPSKGKTCLLGRESLTKSMKSLRQKSIERLKQIGK